MDNETHPDARTATTFIIGLVVGLGMALFVAMMMACQPAPEPIIMAPGPYPYTVETAPVPQPMPPVQTYPTTPIEAYPMPYVQGGATVDMPTVVGNPTVPMPTVNTGNFDWSNAVIPQQAPDAISGSLCVEQNLDAAGNLLGERTFQC